MLTAALREDAERHIDRLAVMHRVKVHRSKRKHFWTYEADVPTRQVFIGRICTGADYLGALHELGHIVDRTARSRFSREHTTSRARRVDGVVEEAAAWAWAIDQALPRLRRACTEADWRRIGTAWVSYAH